MNFGLSYNHGCRHLFSFLKNYNKACFQRLNSCPSQNFNKNGRCLPTPKVFLSNSLTLNSLCDQRFDFGLPQDSFSSQTKKFKDSIESARQTLSLADKMRKGINSSVTNDGAHQTLVIIILRDRSYPFCVTWHHFVSCLSVIQNLKFECFTLKGRWRCLVERYFM